MQSIRSTDCSVISEGGRPVQDNFQDHQSQLMLGMYVICFRLQFIIQFVQGQKEVIFAETAQVYFCVLKMSHYTAACIIKALSQLLPKYESRTWDAKTRKLLSYQIVISGKIQYFRTFFSEAYSLKEFCHLVCMCKPNMKPREITR